MKIFNTDINEIKEPIVASIGFFDGVHKGHRFLIKQIEEEAKKRSLQSGVITFVEHPRKVLQSDYQPALLCGFDEKVKQLSTTGIDYCIPLNFTEELSKYAACEFMKYVLQEQYNVDTLVIGYDHRFGHDRSDDFAQYVRYGEQMGMNVVRAKELNTGEYVSSSHIRSLVKEGKIDEANKLLTYNYTISGKIVEGFKVGRSIGFPTANIQVWERFKVIPARGVYAVHVLIADDAYKGMLYIGNRPTVHNSPEVSIEVNIFDFDGDLYGTELTVEFIKFMRQDVKFPSLEILKRQLQADQRAVKDFFGLNKT